MLSSVSHKEVYLSINSHRRSSYAQSQKKERRSSTYAEETEIHDMLHIGSNRKPTKLEARNAQLLDALVTTISKTVTRQQEGLASQLEVGAKAEQSEEELKEWRNSLRHIANVVAHMMKTSSLFVNLVVSMAKLLLPSLQANSPGDSTLIKETFSTVVRKAARWSESIFERHRQLVKLVNRATGSAHFDASVVCEFASDVSLFSKQELGSQSSFVNSVLEEFGKK